MLGQRIQASRKAANLTQQQLAHRLGLHTMTISYYERGEWPVPDDRLEQIADVLEDPSLLTAPDGPETLRAATEPGT